MSQTVGFDATMHDDLYKIYTEAILLGDCLGWTTRAGAAERPVLNPRWSIRFTLGSAQPRHTSLVH